MAGNEGVERLRLLGRRIAVFGGFAGLFFMCVFSLVAHRVLLELMVYIAAPVLFGGLLQMAAWLIEGFLVSRR